MLEFNQIVSYFYNLKRKQSISVNPTNTTLLILYVIVLLYTMYRILMDTDDVTKTIAYLSLVILVPFVGMIIYYSVGINYRKRNLYSKMLIENEANKEELQEIVSTYSKAMIDVSPSDTGHFRPLAVMLERAGILSTKNNKNKLLINGEKKFPDMLDDLRDAKDHIHLEYYIYEDDDIGNEVADILIEKAQAVLDVRFIYDDFGSSKLRKKFIKRLEEAGVEVAPFYKIQWLILANSLNYRNHRKIVVIDGKIGYVGGINVSNKYINLPQLDNDMYWRDTHMRIEGVTAFNLQNIFLTDWNFCAKQDIKLSNRYFPTEYMSGEHGHQLTQVVRSGPDSQYSAIMDAFIKAINLAKKEVLITTPYFIPDKSFIDAMKIAARTGLKVQLLIPGVSDSSFVNAVSNTYYEDLLEAGVEVFKYRKGFVHAKTIVCDGQLGIVGTANLDQRSFNLNFEVAAFVYDADFAEELRGAFEQDLQESNKLDLEEWRQRPKLTILGERIARLFAPLM